jgi:hypothetical protein
MHCKYNLTSSLGEKLKYYMNGKTKLNLIHKGSNPTLLTLAIISNISGAIVKPGGSRHQSGAETTP